MPLIHPTSFRTMESSFQHGVVRRRSWKITRRCAFLLLLTRSLVIGQQSEVNNIWRRRRRQLIQDKRLDAFMCCVVATSRLNLLDPFISLNCLFFSLFCSLVAEKTWRKGQRFKCAASYTTGTRVKRYECIIHSFETFLYFSLSYEGVGWAMTHLFLVPTLPFLLAPGVVSGYRTVNGLQTPPPIPSPARPPASTVV